MQIGLDQLFCAASSTVTIDFKLADKKLENFETYLLKLEKNLSFLTRVFIDIFFCKNAVLNICRYLKPFYNYNKKNNIFLKFDLKTARNHRNRLNLSCRKTRFKNITNAHINRFNSGQLNIVDVLTKSTYSREFQPPEITVCLQISNKRRPYLAWSLLSGFLT